MTLWNYLVSKMQKYQNKMAFYNSKLTYRDLINLPTSNNKRKLKIIDMNSKEDQAIQILKSLANNEVAVPLIKEYGIKNYEYIKNLVNNSNEDVDDLAFLMFTSGTTGVPKGVMLTDENIISNLEAIKSYFNVENAQSICIARPLVHIAVLTGELLYALINGLTIYFFEEPFMPRRLLSYFNQNKIDIFGGTPTLFSLLASSSLRSNLKIGVISGELLNEKIKEKIVKTFPKTDFYNVYGLTEHSPRVSALLPYEFKYKTNSVGKVLPNVQIKIIDNELFIKSKSVMKGYFIDRKQTKEKIKSGWLATKDLARVDEDGYLYIMGRKDNLIIRSGINIYPEEIEMAAKEIDGVLEVLVGSEIKENQTCIYLKYVGTINELALKKELIKRINLNVIPNKIIKVQSIEKTPSGKIKRR